MKKKILIISMAYYPRFVGGAEVALKELTDRLADRYEFHMVTLRYDSTLPRVSKEGFVTVYRIGFSTRNPKLADLRRFPLHMNKYVFQFSAFLKALSLHRMHSFDGVWAMMAHSAGVPAGLFSLVHPKIPLILTLQEGDTPEHIAQKARGAGFLFSLPFRRARAIQAISTFLSSWAVSLGAHKTPIIIPNGVTFARFAATNLREERTITRAQWGVEASSRCLITASRLVEKNGIDLVIEALEGLPNDVVFIVAGDGPQREVLERQALLKGVTSRVRFLGEIAQADLPKHLKAADVFIRASRSEGLGISFIEAQAAGLPTIGTRVGGIPDIIRDGITGYLAEPTAQSVKETLLRVFSNNEKAREVAVRGQAQAQEYDWDILAVRMEREVFEPSLSV